MAAFAKIIKAIVMLASLAASLETIIRLARFAWSLVLQLQRLAVNRNLRWVRA